MKYTSEYMKGFHDGKRFILGAIHEFMRQENDNPGSVTAKELDAIIESEFDKVVAERGEKESA